MARTTAYPSLDYVVQPVGSQITSRYERISARLRSAMRSVTGIFAKCEVVRRVVTTRSLHRTGIPFVQRPLFARLRRSLPIPRL